MEADISSQAVGLASSADFSLINLFIRADIIVKSVIILLVACSIYSWAVIIEKFKLFKKINQSSEEFEKKFWNSKSAESFYNNLPANVDDPMALVFKDAMQSLLKRKSKIDLNNRMTTMLETGIEKQMNKISKGFTFLATVGSTAPFIGLFGTVWGIMNSFQSIAISRNTSLAIVAPGIAEALFATALGLLAAIPAVIAYNKFGWKNIQTNATEDKVLSIFKHFGATSVKRYELPNLMALNFVIQNALGGGVNSSLRLDRHGKTLSSYLLYNLILDVSLDMMPDNSPYREKFK